ncbi:DUF3418 domain-containing protein [Opitutus sp. ER46]|uniref:DUF3418 domain-containing protein n=1 Tax=Opitutus sp. ER46 TaxID=2161864 RepID=UPI000D30B5B6|nr:DUF3418 domain-containing protein [Opitutus sp. ER46]PTX91744.1 ATP-dependent RNA helicase HrpA [Opitutus sp. ER46]
MASSSRKSFPFRLEFPPELPISARAEEITAAIQASQVVILAGETGSGKTTQIPKMCLAAGCGQQGRIACTQPRRVAALSISRRVAEELAVEWGREVGCKVRFNDQTSRDTLIKFVTDGMLLAELQNDPMLREYDTIIIDEAHERSLNIDFLLGHLRTLRFRRPELKIIITSATIDTEAFSAAFDGAPVLLVEGRTYPVEVIYAPLDELGSDYTENDENDSRPEGTSAASVRAEALHYIDGTVEAVERICRESATGDVLVFLPSERDIREVGDLLDGRRLRGTEVVPLFGRLSMAEQQRVFAPSTRRKLVLATNIAETSLTIPGIRFVVDTGLARISRYSAQSRTRRLPIEEIAQSSADQRKGRAGRVAEGVCIRLYSEKDFLERPRFTQPEIQRANLADVILRMKAFGLGDIERFPFINMPATKAVRAGYSLLEELGAIGEAEAGSRKPEARSQRPEARSQRPEAGGQPVLRSLGEGGKPEAGLSAGAWAKEDGQTSEVRRQKSEEGSRSPAAREPVGEADVGGAAFATHVLTSIGRELARLPVDPTVGRMILQARAEKALREVIVIAAGLSIQDPRERPLDKQQQADTAHRRFAHPDSDFLTLLNIWTSYHGEFESLSQAKLRRFCRDHFLSYTRMREWRDIHAQLLEVLEQRDDFRLTSALDAVARQGERTVRATEGHGHGRRGDTPPARPNAPGKPDPRARAAGPEPKRSGGPAAPAGGRRPAAEPGDPLAFGTPAYRAIHRSILAGLLGNIAVIDEENGGYRATHDRKVSLFPGSVLFRREDPKRKGAAAKPADAGESAARRNPRWIMAAEIVETARLYARTCARLDPQWALDLGQHLVRVAHSEPFWNEAAGRVMVRQRTRLYGLELESRAVGYGRIDPDHATEIFIREGLVNDTIRFPLDFIPHNRAVRDEVEDLLTRARDSGYLNLDEAAYRFYAARLMPDALAATAAPGSGESPANPAESSGAEAVARTEPAPAAAPRAPKPLPAAVSSVPELVDLVRHRRTTDPRFLFMAAEDLRDPATLTVDADAFPKSVPLENTALPLNYAYKPGQPDDGVSVNVTVREAEALTPAALDWAVPGHLEAKVEHYLRALPKELRRAFVPLGESAKTLAGELTHRELSDRPLTDALSLLIAEKYRVAVDPAVWADKLPPEHLRVRIRVVDAEGRELCASRELAEIRAALLAQSREASIAVAREEPAAWRAARAQWETPEFGSWAFDSIPERVLVAEQGGAPVYAFPGLLAGAGGVARRLFKTPEEADAATRRAVSFLLERQLGHDLMWTQRDLRSVREVGPLAATLASVESLQEQAFVAVRRWVTDPARALPPAARSREGAAEGRLLPDGAGFAAAAEQAKTDLRGLVPRLVDLLREILGLRLELLVLKDPPKGLGEDLAALLPADFLASTPYEQLRHFPRYLKAMKLRAERWRKNPGKDSERAAQLAPYEKALAELQRRPGTDAAALAAFRWQLEEFRVSLFAQELGTAEPVSAVKLDRAIGALRAGPAAARAESPATASAARPILTAPIVPREKKSAPLKNLGALDKLFGR